VVRDDPSSVLVIMTPVLVLCLCALAAPVRQTQDTVRMRLAWQVAEGGHPTADSLGELSGIAIDRAGNVYVSDFSATKLWVFDEAGRSRPGIGRKGQGPGEFQAPTGVALGPDGRLYVRDAVRVNRFVRDDATGRLTRYDTAFAGPKMADWRSKRATRFDSAGRLYYPGFNSIIRTQRTGYYRLYTLAGVLTDSIEVPAFPDAPRSTAFVRLSANGGRMLRGLNHVPFAPLPTWDVTSRGTLLTGDGKSYAIRETDKTGREVRVYRRTVAPDRISARERQDSAAALRSRLDSVSATVPLDKVEGMPSDVRAGRLPVVYPPYMAAYGGQDGRVWVRRWPPGGADQTIFDVFDPDGRLRAVVVLPNAIAADATPVLSLDGVAAIGIDRDTGANTIIRFVAR
jgi:sugar lactone lactonase YvrE